MVSTHVLTVVFQQEVGQKTLTNGLVVCGVKGSEGGTEGTLHLLVDAHHPDIHVLCVLHHG